MHRYLKLDEEYYKLKDKIEEGNLCEICPHDKGMYCIPARKSYIYTIANLEEEKRLYTFCFITNNYIKVTDTKELLKAITNNPIHLEFKSK